MTEDWHFQYPSTSVTKTHKGDRNYAETFRGAANKLLYELKNLMKFRSLGQLKMTRLFTDGTVITAKSHFGYDSVEIDVSESKLVAEINCAITLIDIPDAIPPMKYSGEIHEGEVEGIDYIKTYYIIDTTQCNDCADPDFTVCDTTELTEDETICKPFEFVDATVESKEGEPDNHCVISSSHCQAEIISFGTDGGGTYFLWKAYTEWGEEFTQSGLGYMLLRGFIKREGQEDELCTNIEIMVQVDCCEKNSDEYKAVHPIDWGDLDIEYTSLVMGCDEIQELTAKYGCPPFTWTLTSGGGTLTPSEDGLTAIYESPETNPNCVSNPTILLEDRCVSKELKLAVNCFDLPWHAYKYVENTICRPCAKSVTPFCDMKLIVGVWNYACNGALVVSYYYGGPTDDDYITAYNCSDPDIYEYLNCGDPECWEFMYTCGANCQDWYGQWWTGYSVGWHDVRSQYTKEHGCCPINPETGLPY